MYRVLIKRKRKSWAIPLVGWLCLWSLPVLAANDESDPSIYGGLPPGPGQIEVYGLCSACHSLMIVKQQGLSKKSWLETLEWMTEEQGMADLPEEMRDRIATYLSEHYGVDRELPEVE
ncbi:MAG: hypothetical protein MI864_00625 [Pseudomonadales bacterium]|nr:hypothetical protein [Pseudomonadales bacterium]